MREIALLGLVFTLLVGWQVKHVVERQQGGGAYIFYSHYKMWYGKNNHTRAL